MPSPSNTEIRDILLGHLANLYTFYGEYTGVRMARKHISWYSKGQKHGAAFRQAVNKAETIEKQLEMTQDFFKTMINREEIAA